MGSQDMNTRVYGAERFRNLIVYSLGGHTDSIVNAFFEHESLNVSYQEHHYTGVAGNRLSRVILESILQNIMILTGIIII